MPRVYKDENDNWIYDNCDLTQIEYVASGITQPFVLPRFTGSGQSPQVELQIDGFQYTVDNNWTSLVSSLNSDGAHPGPFTMKLNNGNGKVALLMWIRKAQRVESTSIVTYYVLYGEFYYRNGSVVSKSTKAGVQYNDYNNTWHTMGSSDQSTPGILIKTNISTYMDAVNLANSIEPDFPCWKCLHDNITTLADAHATTAGIEMDTWLLSEEGWNMDNQWNRPRSILNAINAYILSDDELDKLQDALWVTDGMTGSKFSNGLYANPMECILGLNFIPFTTTPGTAKVVRVGLEVLQYEGASLSEPVLINEYVEVSFASKTIPRLFNDYRDYTETQCELYLPCIGWHNLNSEEVVGQTLNIHYRINFVTGDILAILSIGDNIIDSVPGNCLQSIPFSGRDMTNLIGAQRQANGNLLSMGAGVISMAAGVGMAAAGNPLGLGMAAGGVGTIINGMNNVANASNEVSKAQNQVVKSGSIGGSTGILGYNIPYLVMKTHTDAMPVGYEEYIGESAHKIMQVGLLTGYVKTQSYRANFTDATDEEKAEINALMDGGVIV